LTSAVEKAMNWLHNIFVQPVADYHFMRVTMATAVVVGLSVGVVSCLMVVRRSVMLGDALGHAVLPGVVVGWMVWGQAGVLVGAVTVAVLCGTGIAYIERSGKLALDSALGVIFAAAFAAGLAIVSFYRPTGFSLDALLLGSILGTTTTDLWVTAAGGVLAIGLVALAFHHLRAWSFDPDVAVSLGIPVGALRYLSYILIGLTVVIALKTVGIVLVVALVAIPGSTARLLTNRLGPMMLVSSALGAAGAIGGMYLSYHLGVAAGPAIALVLAMMFTVVFVFSPSSGVLTRWTVIRRTLADSQAEALLSRLLVAADYSRSPVRLSSLAPHSDGSDAPVGGGEALGGAGTIAVLQHLQRRGLAGTDGKQAWLTTDGFEAAQRLHDNNLHLRSTRDVQ